MERRQVERRSRQSGSAKCLGCDHVNEPGMKFCGMCGTRVDRRMEERRGMSDASRAAAIANAQLPSPETKGRATTQVAAPPSRSDEAPVALPRRSEPAIFRNDPPRNEAVHAESVSSEAIRNESGNGGRISGPSFLGLNSQPDNNGDVEYLLEDQPTGGGLRKFLLLVILAAILGLLFVQWRSSFKASPKPPAPAKSDPSTPATAPQGNNQPADLPGSAVTDSPKVAASGVSAVAAGAAAELKAPKTEPTALETTSPSPWLLLQTKTRASQNPQARKTLPRFRRQSCRRNQSDRRSPYSRLQTESCSGTGPAIHSRSWRRRAELRTRLAVSARSYR